MDLEKISSLLLYYINENSSGSIHFHSLSLVLNSFISVCLFCSCFLQSRIGVCLQIFHKILMQPHISTVFLKSTSSQLLVKCNLQCWMPEEQIINKQKSQSARWDLHFSGEAQSSPFGVRVEGKSNHLMRERGKILLHFPGDDV